MPVRISQLVWTVAGQLYRMSCSSEKRRLAAPISASPLEVGACASTGPWSSLQLRREGEGGQTLVLRTPALSHFGRLVPAWHPEVWTWNE